MDVFEISGFKTGIDKSGVNFLDPADAFETISNGLVYRQEVKSRKGFSQFANRLPSNPLPNSRVMGIFENVLINSTRQLVVVDQNYFYLYNSGTDEFDLIPDTSDDGDVYPFSISSPEDYVTGTTYLGTDLTNSTNRFVFTGKGMTNIYFFDGTGIKKYTNLVDNPNYQAPAGGALTNATSIIWFGGRLTLFVPTIDGQANQQGVLYSAIRNVGGNGDKFNTVGSGLLEADTYEILKGALTLGDIVVMNFQRSNWTLEKTRDAFNPYFVRKIPSVLGTDAGFSAVSWAYEVKSIGNTGLITTDGRQSNRFDNLIPYFAADDIEQKQIELTYGGFDRINGQFLFAYRSTNATLDTTTQDKVLVYNYEFHTWAINDQRFSVFGQTDDDKNFTWDDIDETNDEHWVTWDETEDIWNKIGLGDASQKTLAGDNLGFVYEINKSFDDYFVEISGITNAFPAVCTISASAFQVDDEVTFKYVEGMTEINGETGIISAVNSPTEIEVDIDTSIPNYGVYTGSAGIVSKLIDFNAKTTVFNPYRADGRRCWCSHLEFLLNTGIGDLYVDIIEDEEEAPFKTVLLQTSTDTTKKREWITVIVNDEANFFTFVLRSKSVTNQKIISAIRIHASPGGLTAG